MIDSCYKFRFEIFLVTQMGILFGSLIVPAGVFEKVLEPMLFMVNLLAGVLFLVRAPKLMWFAISMLALSALVFIWSIWLGNASKEVNFIRMTGYFLFYLVVSFEIIRQVWYAKSIGKNVIFGLISGFISLGLIGFFICLSIEMVNPGSFQIAPIGVSGLMTEQLMYFSFITLMTIGYGDMLPVTDLAQKAAMLIGLVGQFYLVIITAVVVGKYVAYNKGRT